MNDVETATYGLPTSKVKQLEGRKIAVFDLEIKKRIEDCSKGWQSHDEMGISVLCLFDYATMRYRVFDDYNKDECLNILHNYDIVSGFNTVNFDWKVVNKSWPNGYTRIGKDFDILREIWVSLGLNPDVFNPRTHGGYKLDDVAAETISMRKTANGALAPVMFQEGRYADLVDYCLEDVRIERTLFEFVVENGYVVRNGKQIPLKIEL
jgi:hypothetical protein